MPNDKQDNSPKKDGDDDFGDFLQNEDPANNGAVLSSPWKEDPTKMANGDSNDVKNPTKIESDQLIAKESIISTPEKTKVPDNDELNQKSDVEDISEVPAQESTNHNIVKDGTIKTLNSSPVPNLMSPSTEIKELPEITKSNEITKEEIKEPNQQIKISDKPTEESLPNDKKEEVHQTQEINKTPIGEESKTISQAVQQTSTNANAAADDEFGDFGDFDKAPPKKEEAAVSSNEYIEVVN
jgi:hypothetical protein